MKKKLTAIKENELYWVNEDDTKIYGTNPKMSGTCAGLIGDCTGLYGDCSELRGDCSGVYGYCSGIVGNLDDCEITAEDRIRHVYIEEDLLNKEEE